MAPPGDTQITEATETTALLSKDATKSIDPLSNGTNGHAVNVNAVLTDTVDPENGQIEEVDNSPLLASKPEPPQNLYLFLPAMGLGVRWILDFAMQA
jgi:nitroreductase